ncbi:hypothetical protein [Paraburkholderia lycopersici]|uniref:Uncharacterized protein n=1 Tax=Paraburkholderia lycopersici TaxID=416944 RepID=A0A1G6W704_9BURK|nr:hypothetical protein [Paraburkholderia lycopersici]SDD61720.1 hypothetical protein SAMN05421548_12288 [Paraburkholderia lycopersici]
MPSPFFSPDPFEQAAAEVANKSWDEQILHSRLFHSTRSAFSSLFSSDKGSAASKGLGAAVGIGKLFLSLIPVPVVGAISGAIIDGANDFFRSKKHESQTKAAEKAGDKANLVKFEIKELTVENLDRYRWKVAHAFDALNDGIQEFNKKKADDRTCDDIYALALLIQQVERRKDKLRDELGNFKKVLDHVNEWIVDLETTKFADVHNLKEKLKESTRDTFNGVGITSLFGDEAGAKAILAMHASCQNWCCAKETAKYDPNSWPKLKRRVGSVVMAAAPVAFSAVTVKAGDYRNDSSNSSMR